MSVEHAHREREEPGGLLGVQAMAQAAAYPGLQPKQGVQPQKLAATLASVIVSGDQAAANRAPAPYEANAEGAEENDAVKVSMCSWSSTAL